jgi:hypothetical protein
LPEATNPLDVIDETEGSDDRDTHQLLSGLNAASYFAGVAIDALGESLTLVAPFVLENREFDNDEMLAALKEVWEVVVVTGFFG